MPGNTLSSGWPIVLIVAIAACGSTRHLGRGNEPAGTPSPSGCDAWLEIGGTFSRVNDVRYILQNRSTDPACSATRAAVLFSGRLPAAVRVSAPSGWTTRKVRCRGGGICGIEWQTHDGVLPGHELRGFGLSYDPTGAPRQELWIVEVGRRRVEMPIGKVGD